MELFSMLFPCCLLQLGDSLGQKPIFRICCIKVTGVASSAHRSRLCKMPGKTHPSVGPDATFLGGIALFRGRASSPSKRCISIYSAGTLAISCRTGLGMRSPSAETTAESTAKPASI
jgi:hypothetical protein